MLFRSHPPANLEPQLLTMMNRTIRGIEGDFGLEHADTFRRDLHKDLKADDVLANPQFNDSDWHRSDEDVRWKYGLPPKGNANFAWVQHFIHLLSPSGCAGFALANGGNDTQPQDHSWTKYAFSTSGKIKKPQITDFDAPAMPSNECGGRLHSWHFRCRSPRSLLARTRPNLERRHRDLDAETRRSEKLAEIMRISTESAAQRLCVRSRTDDAAGRVRSISDGLPLCVRCRSRRDGRASKRC